LAKAESLWNASSSKSSSFKMRQARRLRLGSSSGRSSAFHIDKSLLKDGIYQTAEARPILRAGRLSDYALITPETMFEMHRPPDDRH
jgi:hypothetical protein